MKQSPNGQEPPSVTARILNPPTPEPAIAVTDTNGELALKIQGYPPNTTVMVNYELTAPNYESEIGSVELTSGNSYSFEVPMTRII